MVLFIAYILDLQFLRHAEHLLIVLVKLRNDHKICIDVPCLLLDILVAVTCSIKLNLMLLPSSQLGVSWNKAAAELLRHETLDGRQDVG